MRRNNETIKENVMTIANTTDILENIESDHIISPSYNFSKERILFVDDDPDILSTFERQFHRTFSVDVAQSANCAIDLIKKNESTYSVIVADMQMPLVNGIEFLKQVKEITPMSVRIMLTGNADQATAIGAVNQGHIYQFLNKPCPKEFLEMTLKSAIKHYWLAQTEQELFEKTLQGSLKIMTELLCMTRPHLFVHGLKLQDLASDFNEHAQLDKPSTIKLAIMLSQIGFMTITDELVGKMRTDRILSPSEEAVLSKVPSDTAKLLSKIPHLGEIAHIVSHLETHYDGQQSPDGLSGEKIPVIARLIKILSDYINLQSHGQSKQQVVDLLDKRIGWYDREILLSFKKWLLDNEIPEVEEEAIAVEELSVNDLITQDVKTKDGKIFLSAEDKVSSLRLIQLQNYHELYGLAEPIYVKRGR